MLMKYLVSALLLLISLSGNAQRADSLSLIRTGFICQFTYNANFPGGDLGRRYGTGSEIGAGVYYKTGSNWIFGVEGGYWFGGSLREEGIYDAVVDSNGYAVNINGGFVRIESQQRGFTLGAKVGKIIPLGRKNRNSGLMLSLGVGYLEHYLRLANNTRDIAAFQGDLRYGYDRLCSGVLLREFVGYQFLHKKNRINFFAGLEFGQGFTYSRRTIDYDLMRGQNGQRFDSYVGIRLGWLLPIYTGVASGGGGYRFK